MLVPCFAKRHVYPSFKAEICIWVASTMRLTCAALHWRYNRIKSPNCAPCALRNFSPLGTFTLRGHECGKAKLFVSAWSQKHLFLSQWRSVLRAQAFGGQRETGVDLRHAAAGGDGRRARSVWSGAEHLHAQSRAQSGLTGAPEKRRAVCCCRTREVQENRVRSTCMKHVSSQLVVYVAFFDITRNWHYCFMGFEPTTSAMQWSTLTACYIFFIKYSLLFYYEYEVESCTDKRLANKINLIGYFDFFKVIDV